MAGEEDSLSQDKDESKQEKGQGKRQLLCLLLLPLHLWVSSKNGRKLPLSGLIRGKTYSSISSSCLTHPSFLSSLSFLRVSQEYTNLVTSRVYTFALFCEWREYLLLGISSWLVLEIFMNESLAPAFLSHCLSSLPAEEAKNIKVRPRKRREKKKTTLPRIHAYVCDSPCLFLPQED